MSDGSPRRIWLCADDYGMAPGISRAIRDLVARSRLNATSVMVVAPTFSKAEAQALDASNKARRAVIGLHLTFTAPFRPLSTGYAPLRDGAFLPLPGAAGRALFRTCRPKLIELEMTRQFAAFEDAFGRPPDFVDGHQHIHLFPQLREALLRVIKIAAPQAWARQCCRAAARRPFTDPKGLFLDRLSLHFRRLAEKGGVRTNTAFAGTYAFNDKADFARLFPKFLEGLPAGGLVMCHPGFVDAELRRLDPVTDLREREYAYLADNAFPRLLATHGVALT